MKWIKLIYKIPVYYVAYVWFYFKGKLLALDFIAEVERETAKEEFVPPQLAHIYNAHDRETEPLSIFMSTMHSEVGKK
ncbi:MAG: hypothetical protein V3T31_08055 [candidate division Zixibacteria bacterium]